MDRDVWTTNATFFECDVKRMQMKSFKGEFRANYGVLEIEKLHNLIVEEFSNHDAYFFR